MIHVDTQYARLSDAAVAAHGQAMQAKIPAALARVKAFHDDNILPYLRLPFQKEDLAALKPLADEFAALETVLILGTGGSSLGGKTLYALADQGFGNRNAGRPKLYFLDNVDPVTFDALGQQVNLAKTGVLVISKSGTTAETLCQFLTLLPALQQANPEHWARQVIAITEPGNNILRDLAGKHGIRVLDHDPKVGGRFSVLSLVGMLPAMIAGIDAAAIRAGAAKVLEPALHGDVSHPAATGAAWNMAWAAAGRNQTIIMPYIDQLTEFGMWYRQLWAESIGKDGHGTTPIRAMGTVDQHSQMQLYLDGPKDKIFTVVIKDATGHGKPVSSPDSRLGYLNGRTMGDLLAAEQQATIVTLAGRGCPVRVLRIPAVTPETLGALFMHYMLETIVAAELIGVNAFDQPAVEEGKILTRQYLSEQKAA